VVKVELTAQGQALVKKAPKVAQGLLVEGLEKLNEKKLINIAQGLDQMVDILGAQNIPPQLILSPEVNKPGKTKVDDARIKAATKQRLTAKTLMS
jgi:hypothetical protein